MRFPRLPILVLSLALLAPACVRNADVAHSGSVISDAFQTASVRYDVPRPLLEAIGWQESHWFMPPHRNIEGGYGMMNLRDGSTLQKAHEITGLPLDRLEHDPVANILGRAAELRARADRYFAEYPSRDPARLADWFEVVKEDSGYDSAELAEAYAKGVYQAVQMGARKLFEDGVVVQLFPSKVDIAKDLVFSQQEDYLTPDYPNAIWRAADPSNYSVGRSRAIDTVVIHTIQGSYLGAISWFKNPSSNVSAHYVVSKTGEITQMVQDKDTAWHARCWNSHAIGIEHDGYVSDPNNYTDAMYKASAALGRWLADKYGIPKYHHAGPEGGTATGKGFKGHVDLSDCNTHTDPGPYWNWTYYMSLVQGGGGTSPTGQLTGAIFWGTDFNTDKSDMTKRISGASVSVGGGKSTTTDASGIYTFTLAPGTYTVTASANGYTTETKSVTVTANTTSWGSVMLTKQNATLGTVEGYVFWGNTQSDYATNLKDASKRLSGATVTFSPGGKTATTNANGLYTVKLSPGSYTVHAAATGYLANDRPNPVTVTANATTWGSTMVLAPSGTTDTTPPTVEISAPSDGDNLDLPTVQVVGTVSDQSAISTVTVNGAATTLKGSGFSAQVSLTPGSNTITVAATDAAGNVGSASVTVNYTGTSTGVTGFVYDASKDKSARVEGATVSVGEGAQAAQVQTAADGTFVLDTSSGSLPATVTAPGFKTWVGSVTVTDGGHAELDVGLHPGQDAQPGNGKVSITFPTDGQTLTHTQVLVTGTTSGSDVSKVTVNGKTAALGTEGAFSVKITLKPGKDAITAKALDATGADLGEATIHVTVEPAVGGCACSATGGDASGLVWPIFALLGFALMRRRRAAGA